MQSLHVIILCASCVVISSITTMYANDVIRGIKRLFTRILYKPDVMTPLEMLDGKVGILERKFNNLPTKKQMEILLQGQADRIVELEEQVINVAEKYASSRKYDRELIRKEVKNYLIKLQNK